MKNWKKIQLFKSLKTNGMRYNDHRAEKYQSVQYLKIVQSTLG